MYPEKEPSMEEKLAAYQTGDIIKTIEAAAASVNVPLSTFKRYKQEGVFNGIYWPLKGNSTKTFILSKILPRIHEYLAKK